MADGRTTYSGLWRSWATKTVEADAEKASAAWLGDPSQSVQHQTDWGALVDNGPFPAGSTYDVSSGAASGDPRATGGTEQVISPTHGVANTAAGRQLLGAGHSWADAPPPTLDDHLADAPGTWGGGGALSLDDYDGQAVGQHNVDWGDLGDRHSGDWGTGGRPPSLDDSFQGSDDVNYPATGHQVDKGEIAAKQRRMIPRGQSTDEKDTSEAYQFAPYRAGGSQAQIVLSRTADPAVAAEVAPKHTPGVEYGRAAGPAISWANAHGTGPADGAYESVRNRRWVERRIPGRHFWRHDMRPLFWRFAHTATTTGEGQTHATSPFESGTDAPADVSVRTFFQPVLRRTPPAWDETATTDGTEQGGALANPGDMWSGFGGL